jgi:hypothetical protein
MSSKNGRQCQNGQDGLQNLGIGGGCEPKKSLDKAANIGILRKKLPTTFVGIGPYGKSRFVHANVEESREQVIFGWIHRNERHFDLFVCVNRHDHRF